MVVEVDVGGRECGETFVEVIVGVVVAAVVEVVEVVVLSIVESIVEFVELDDGSKIELHDASLTWRHDGRTIDVALAGPNTCKTLLDLVEVVVRCLKINVQYISDMSGRKGVRPTFAGVRRCVMSIECLSDGV